MLALLFPLETAADELEKGGQVNVSAPDNCEQCARLDGKTGLNMKI